MLNENQKPSLSVPSRNYGIDAFRIISMLMVVMLHVLRHGGILESAESANYWAVWFLEILAYCAVNCYALVSGYVGVYAKYKISNLAILWCRVAFYTIPITVVCKIVFPDKIGLGTLVSAFFPVYSGAYWYFTAYAVMFLFIPFMNEAVARLSQNALRFSLIAIVISVSVIRPFASIIWDDIFKLQNGYSGWWLMILYLIGAYVRKYGLFNRIKSHRTGIFLSAYFAFAVITWLSKLILQFISYRLFGEIKLDGILVEYCSITILGCAVSLLLAFEQLKLRSAMAKAVAILSPLAFSVYLIHEQFFIKNEFIVDKLKWVAGLPVWQVVPTVLGIVIAIYLICSIIDLGRHYLFTKLDVKNRLIRSEEKLKKKLLKLTGSPV